MEFFSRTAAQFILVHVLKEPKQNSVKEKLPVYSSKQVASVMAAKDRITAAVLRMKLNMLSISDAGKCPFPKGDTPPYYMI